LPYANKEKQREASRKGMRRLRLKKKETDFFSTMVRENGIK